MPGSANVFPSPVFRHLCAGWAIATALVLCGVSYGAAMPLAQKHESRQRIDVLEDEWRDAVLTSNTKTLASLLADDYVAITPSGTLQSRDEALESLRTGRVRFTTLNITDRKVRFYGTTAVVTSLANVVATTPDGTVSGSYRYTRVYVRDAAGVWKIVSFEASRVREPGPHIKNEIP